MRVLEVGIDTKELGGGLTIALQIVRFRPRGAVVDFAATLPFSRREYVEEMRANGVTVYYIGKEGSRLLREVHAFHELRKILRSNYYDVVHLHFDVAYKLFFYGLAAKSSGHESKLVMHSHASSIRGDFRLFRLLLHFVSRPFLKFLASDFVTCSDLAGRWMYPCVRPSEVEVVKNGINLSLFRFSVDTRLRIRRELGIADGLLLGHVGRFSEQKNHSFLVDVFFSFHKRHRNSRLLLLGEGDLKDGIRAKVERLGLSEHVIFHSPTSRVYELMQAMDVFVLPSLFEGLPFVVVEAQAAALPCVLADTISRDSKIIDNVDFLPINNAVAVDAWVDAIERLALLNRVDTYDEMKLAGFDAEDSTSKVWEIYKR